MIHFGRFKDSAASCGKMMAMPFFLSKVRAGVRGYQNCVVRSTLDSDDLLILIF